MVKINYISVGYRTHPILASKVQPVFPTKKTSDKNPGEKNTFLYTFAKFNDDKDSKIVNEGKSGHIDIRI